MFAGGDTVEPREGLHCLHTCQSFHHIHGLQQGLIKAGLILIGNQEYAVIIPLKGFG